MEKKGRTVSLNGSVLHIFKHGKALIFVSNRNSYHRIEADSEFISRVKPGDRAVLQVDDVVNGDIPTVIEARSISRIRKDKAKL